MKLKKNVGKIDQIIRYIIALVLVVLAVLLNIYWLIIPALIVFGAALFSFCGLYRLFGINTCKIEKE